MQQTTRRITGEMNQLARTHHAQTAKAAFALADHTFVTAQRAANATRIARRFDRQIKLGARIGMNRFHACACGDESPAQASATDADRCGNERRRAMAEQTTLRAGYVHYCYKCTAKMFSGVAVQSTMQRSRNQSIRTRINADER